MVAKTLKKPIKLTDSDVQVMYSVALVMAFHAAESENRPLEDFPRADFGRVPEKISFVGEEKTTPIVVFVMIQRIFTS